MPDTSSDSSDDEVEMKKLKEAAIDAVDIVRHQAPIVSKNETKNRQKQPTTLPSKRNVATNNAAEADELDVTPELRTFLAKKLGELMESQIEDSSISGELKNVSQLDDGDNSDGVRLLSTSRSCLTVDTVDSQVKKSAQKVKATVPLRPKKKKKNHSNASSSDSSDDDGEKLKGLAVTGEFIVTEAKRSAEQRRIEFEHDVNANKAADATSAASKSSVQVAAVMDNNCDKNVVGGDCDATTDKSDRTKHKKKKRKHASE